MIDKSDERSPEVLVRPMLGDALGSILDAMRDGALGIPLAHRADVFNDEFDGIEVDTCSPPDTGTWETGVQRGKDEGSGGGWVIVEQYASRQAAEAGHARWVALLRENPLRELRDIDLFRDYR